MAELNTGNQALDELLNDPYDEKPIVNKSVTFDETTVNGHIGDTASQWLDDYIEFSRQWSPRAYDGYHEAVGLWLLSTIAQRRIALNLGGMRYPNLYIALVGHTSLWAKSTTAKIAIQALYECGLEWLLAPSDSTPQAFIKALSTPKTVASEAIESKALKHQLQMRGGRGWYYDEFGGKLASMIRQNGTMAEYRTILRRFDDCEDVYSYETISRGIDRVERPYLAMLGNLTPVDIRGVAKRSGSLWNDGFMARIALVGPSEKQLNLGRFPGGERKIPENIIQPLMRWNEQLGWPEIWYDPIEKDGEPTGCHTVEVEDKRPVMLSISIQACDMFYNYHDDLTEAVYRFEAENEDLAGNYIRFAEKALRIAILLASLEGNNRVTERQMNRGIDICERWRENLQGLYETITKNGGSEILRNEELILKFVGQLGSPTANDIKRRVKLDIRTVTGILDDLAKAGIVEKEQTKRSFRYYIIEDVIPITDILKIGDWVVYDYNLLGKGTRRTNGQITKIRSEHFVEVDGEITPITCIVSKVAG